MVQKHSRHDCTVMNIRKRTLTASNYRSSDRSKESHTVNLFSQMCAKYIPKTVRE
jgi:hypothetical protein